MRLGWGMRQFLPLLLPVLILVSFSMLLELANVIKLGIEGAKTEGALISQTLFLQIQHTVGAAAKSPIEALQGDPAIGRILQAAVSQSPSVAFVAISDSSGRAIIHTTPGRSGARLDSLPPLPTERSVAEILPLLPSLLGSLKVYDFSTPLLLGQTPFATIRIGISLVLVRAKITEVVRHGVTTAGILIALAVILGFVLARVTSQRIRILEAGVTALREGRFDSRIPESGLDEFGRLARDLNLLSEQFQKEREAKPNFGAVRNSSDLLGEGLLALDAGKKVTLLNESAERILGISAAEARDQTIDRLLGVDHPVLLLANRIFENGERSLSIPLPHPERDATYLAIGHWIDATDLRNGLLIEFREAEALAQLQSMIEHSRVLSRLGQMAAGVAHEIGNPLQSISIQLGNIRQSQSLSPEEIDESLRTATLEIERLHRATSGFLKVAKLRGLNKASLAIDELLVETHRALEPEANLAGLELDLRVGEELPEVTGDRDVLRQAIENLVKNAVQAVPSREGHVLLSGSSGEHVVEISVSDTGPGIPEESLKKVTELYYTTKMSGSGVGLSLVQQAVELHGGELAIDSTIGSGTTVTIRIPVGAPKEAS